MYTIEDIELIRQKSGISYQEAVSLLDYHNGDVARALVDLEKHGKLNNSTNETTNRNEGKKMSETTMGNETRKATAMNWLQKMYRFRLHVNKKGTTVLNLSVLFSLACLLFAPHLTVIGLILSLVLGYQFSVTKDDTDFASENLEKMVRNAAQNAKASVENAVKNFSAGSSQTAGRQAAATEKKETAAHPAPAGTVNADPNKEVVEDLKNQMDSFFEHNPAATSYRSAYSASAAQVPTIQVPVQVESSEGKMTIEEEQDGYHSATIE